MADDKTAPSLSTSGNEDFAALLAAHETENTLPQVGQKISGKIISISGEDVFLDLGLKEDGLMELKDILGVDGKPTASPGESVEAWVVAVSPQGIRLSRSMYGSGLAALEQARDNALPVEGKVRSVCKGGYQVDVLGKSAFCPASQLGAMGEDPQSQVGRSLLFLVTRLENHGRNIVVSHRALEERERRENLGKLLETLAVGDVVKGKISRLAPFGAFMELAPGVEGMVHLSELGWSHIESADEAVSVGDMLRAVVLGISQTDKGQVRISLSRKKALGDPWAELGAKLKAGEIVSGKVRRLAPFGAFVEILPGIEGLIHISEMSWNRRISKPEDVLAPGDSVEVKIKEIDQPKRRISLSLRDAEGDPWADAPERFKPGMVVQGNLMERNQYGLFIELAPGITGLMPLGIIKKSKNGSELLKSPLGCLLTVIVENVDSSSRRISLIPEGTDIAENSEDQDWRQYKLNAGPSPAQSLGIMAQALQRALQKNK